MTGNPVECVPFGTRVVAAATETGPLCAGIDPSAGLLAQWGLDDDAAGVRAFGLICVEAFAGQVAAVKPQVAFFERHGAAGLAALEEILATAGAAGLLTIADAKRGDIDTTAEAYADAWLGHGSPLAADAVTVHPYLGLGALAPFVDRARSTGRGVFVVTRSSNPEGRSLQEAVTAGGDSVEDALLAAIADLNAPERAGGAPVGSVGAVIGATLAPSSFPLSQVGGVFLAPGLGAQGATATDVGALFAGCAPGTVLANASRGLLKAGPDPADLRRAAISAVAELRAVSV